jgi:hypothetical protein
MTDRTQQKDQTDDPRRPSQAEGERETVEEALGERQETRRPAPGQHDRTPADERGSDPKRPSKPEGERAAAQE